MTISKYRRRTNENDAHVYVLRMEITNLWNEASKLGQIKKKMVELRREKLRGGLW